jgi:hypothetical protein
MTEAEWLAAQNPRRMLDYLEVYHRVARTRNGRRKLRLFTCACCRRLWHVPGSERGKRVVEVLEHFADGLVEWDDVQAAVESEREATKPEWKPWLDRLWDAAECAAQYRPQDATDRRSLFTYSRWGDTEVELCGLLREVFGNPFCASPRMPSAVLAWNDGTVRRIAEGIYQERASDRLPILADALLDAGCDDEALIAHCRGAGPHVRGCWAVDLILGKE